MFVAFYSNIYCSIWIVTAVSTSSY